MILFFLSNLDLEDTGFVSLPEVIHLFDPFKTYMASRLTFVDPKDPSDVIDYRIDWSDLLGEDTISISQWNVPDGITGESATKTNTTTTIWVSEGTEGEDYYIINRITTSDSRTLERTLVVPVRNL